jgi:hypothetical protein
MVTAKIEILEDDEGTFTFQCPSCGFTKQANSPDVKKFKIKCKCGTKIPVILNARGQYRKQTDINALAIKKNHKDKRADAKVKAILTTDSIRFYVVITDMSVFGLRCYFNSSLFRINIEERLTIEYTLHSKSECVDIIDHCTVKWVKDDYFGVQCHTQTRIFNTMQIKTVF